MNPLRLLASAIVVALALGCTPSHEIHEDFASYAGVASDVAPLGGAALAHHKQQLERALKDLGHLQVTLESMDYRGEVQGIQRLGRFVQAYVGLHLDSLLRPEWQSRHVELMALDARLRFAEADILIRVGASSGAQRVIDELQRRFAGRDEMLIEYPLGVQRTLGVGLEYLRADRRHGPLHARKGRRF